MNILLTPRKKALLREEIEPVHSLRQDALQHTLTDSMISYVFWLQEVVDLALANPLLAQLIVPDLPPLEENDSYLSKVSLALQACSTYHQENQHLMTILTASMDAGMQPATLFPTVCELLETIKTHFAQIMDPFKLLVYERSLTFDRHNLLAYYTSLDAMEKVHYHVFRKHPPQDLEVLWMMTSLTNDYLHNQDIIQDIQLNWTNLHSDAKAVREIINAHLHRRGRHSRLPC